MSGDCGKTGRGRSSLLPDWARIAEVSESVIAAGLRARRSPSRRAEQGSGLLCRKSQLDPDVSSTAEDCMDHLPAPNRCAKAAASATKGRCPSGARARMGSHPPNECPRPSRFALKVTTRSGPGAPARYRGHSAEGHNGNHRGRRIDTSSRAKQVPARHDRGDQQHSQCQPAAAPPVEVRHQGRTGY